MSVVHIKADKGYKSNDKGGLFLSEGFHNTEVNNWDKEQNIGKPGYINNGGIRSEVMCIPVQKQEAVKDIYR